MVVADSDCDGIMASILSEYFLRPISSKFIRYNTGDRKLPDFNWDVAKESDIVLFVDIAPYSMEMIEKINEHSVCVLVDHHESSFEILKEYYDSGNYFYATDKCASKIFFEELTNGIRVKKILKQMVDLANCYDLYQIDSIDPPWRNSKGFNNILYGGVNWARAQYQTDTEKYQFFVDNQLKKIENSNEFYFTAKEKEQALKAEEKERKNYQQAKKSLKIRIDGGGNKYAYFECSSKVSWTASLLLREYPDIKYFACHGTFLETYKHEENGKISLRSQEGFDVSKIAVKYSGGGHGAASGMEMPLEDFYRFRKGEIHLI